VTLHRPSNVDDVEALQHLLATLDGLGVRLVFPVHPRTRQRMVATAPRSILSAGWCASRSAISTSFGCRRRPRRVHRFGRHPGETTVLGVPCITLRENTERPVTCEQAPTRSSERRAKRSCRVRRIDEIRRTRRMPENWDGKSAQRIVARSPRSWPDKSAAAGSSTARGERAARPENDPEQDRHVRGFEHHVEARVGDQRDHARARVSAEPWHRRGASTRAGSGQKPGRDRQEDEQAWNADA